LAWWSVNSKPEPRSCRSEHGAFAEALLAAVEVGCTFSRRRNRLSGRGGQGEVNVVFMRITHFVDFVPDSSVTLPLSELREVLEKCP